MSQVLTNLLEINKSHVLQCVTNFAITSLHLLLTFDLNNLEPQSLLNSFITPDDDSRHIIHHPGSTPRIRKWRPCY